MSIEYFVLKTGRYFSLIAVIIFLFLKYYQLPDPVAVFFDTKTNPQGFLPKDQFFYIVALIVIFSTILFEIFTKLVKDFNNKSARSDDGGLFKAILKHSENWINLISSIINILLLLAVSILTKLNTTEYSVTISDYSWFLYLLPICIFMIVLYPFFKILIKKI